MSSNNPISRRNSFSMTLGVVAFGAALIISNVAEAACHWRLEGRLVRSEPLATDDGELDGPGYALDVMTMARFTDNALCLGGDCPFNTTNWVATEADEDGNFVLLSLPHLGPVCHAERDFVFMIQGGQANISSWQTVDNRDGIDGPDFPGPSPVFIHDVNLGDIKVDDLPPPDGYVPPSNRRGVGNATMEPAAGNDPNLPPGTFETAPGTAETPNFPTGTFEPAPFPNLPPAGDGEDEEEAENSLPDVTFEPNPHPFPGPSSGSGGAGDGDQDTDDSGSEDDDSNDTGTDTGFNFPDAQFEEVGCLPVPGSVIEQADFAFGPHPGAGNSNKSPDGLIRVQQRQTGGTPMARRLSVTFEVENHGERHNRRVGDCPVEVQLRLNEGPDLYGDGEEAWHVYEDPMPTINANWQRFVTMSATTRGTGNDTNSSWNEGYEYVRIQVILDWTNGVSEANEGDNVAGEYCYHATTNSFVDMGTCVSAATELE